MKINNYITLLVLVLFGTLSCNNKSNVVNKDKLHGDDYGLFQNTPLWDLAKAAEDNDVEKIKQIVKEGHLDINYQEEKYGKTLLMLTVLNEDYSSCKTLLELGANVNIHDKFNGRSAIIDAAAINSDHDENTKFLNLLIEYKANVNDEEIGKRQEGNSTRNTPLLRACGTINKVNSPIKKVKMLIEAGADINYKNEYNHTPLSKALLSDNFDIVLYLLQKGADYKIPITSHNDTNYYIVDALRTVLLPLDSKEYKNKMEIVEFLKQKGIDYSKAPIPDFVINKVKTTYGNASKEYLEKY